MKIIIIVDSIFPPNTGLTIRMYELAKKLLNNGHSVYIISQGKNKRIIDYNGIKVIQININIKKNIFEQIFRFIYSVKATRIIRSVGLQDADFVIGWNFFPNLASYMISKKYGIKHICDMTDFGFDFFSAAHPNVFWKPVVFFLETIECKIIPRNAYRIVAVSNFMKRILSNKYLINENKIFIINDGMYPNIKPTLSKNKIKKQMGIDKEKIIVFLGNMDRHDGVDILFEAFCKIRREINAKLIFVGGGRKYYRRFKKNIKKSKFGKDVIFTGYVPREMALNYISIADIGVISFRKRLATDNVFTFKFFEYVALGIPVVCSNIETLSQIVKEKNAGIIVEPDNIESLKTGILKILNDRKKYIPDSKKFREFWWNNIMEKYCNFLEDMKSDI